MFAPQPDGARHHVLRRRGAHRRRARSVSAHDAAGYPAFDKKVRALSSFLAYVNAARRPTSRARRSATRSPALKLGRAFRGLGREGRPRGHPCDPDGDRRLRARGSRARRRRAAPSRRARSCTRRWVPGRPARRSCSSTTPPATTAARSGRPTYAKGGPGRARRCTGDARREASGAEVRTGAEVTEILLDDDGRAVGVRSAGGETLQAPGDRDGARPEAHAHAARRPGGARTAPGLARRQHPHAGHDGEGEPRAVGDCRRSRRADDDGALHGRILIAPGIDYLERAYDASKYGRVAEEPFLETTIPSLADPSSRPRGST